MKKIILLFTTFVCFETLAQQTNTLRIYGGTAFFGSGDLRGHHLSTEYQRQLSKWFSVGGEISIANAIKGNNIDAANQTDLNEISSNSALKLNINTYFNIINNTKHLAQVGIGVSGRSGYRAYTGGYGLVRISDNISRYFITRSIFEKRQDLGYVINLGYSYKFNQTWGLNLKASQQMYFSDTETYFSGGIGYSF